MDNRPIGIFDSGIGGISILNKLFKELKNEKFIYLADNKNCPYGNKSKKIITEISIKNCKELIRHDCKIIIVACNTSTTNSIKLLRKIFNCPIIGIEPGIKPAILETKTKKIGVLATEKTLSSDIFLKTQHSNNKEKIKIYEQPGFGLVESLEKGVQEKSIIFKQKLYQYLYPMKERNIDHLVLGCTHYNFLKDEIKKIIGNKIKIVDSIMPVVNQTKKVLNEFNLNSDKTTHGNVKLFYNSKPISKDFIDGTFKMEKKEF
jgi:glutamate racemase